MQAWQLRRIRHIVQHGGIIAYPTEAVYGLGCHPLDADAVSRLCALKQRGLEKGLILIAADLQQLLPYIEPIPAARMRQVNASWPGPVTWLFPARPETPWWLTGEHATIAVRVTAHALSRQICQATGTALVSTSANISQRPPARTALRVRQCFGDDIDYIAHGSLGGRARPSEIRDARSGRILRAG